MPLAASTRLGPYEILAPLGAGGMGEVYRARDTRLSREVAIKVLPEGVARDPERRGRFESEARAVAALSHPNLVAIHDIGAEGDTVYAVMELLDGRTLRERLEEGPLGAARAIAIAIQIAYGLAAAHDKGIVHRDLKPENLILTPDGRVKILDFGLAKRTLPDASGGSAAPTIATSTEPGVVLGTVGYMSPEQVRGQAADPRADIFALGAVLYEMISGRRAFHGASSAETMSAILREDPAALDAVRDLPPAVDRILRRCLEKAPEARFHSARDLAFALEAISSAGHPAIETGRAAGRARVPTFKRLTFRNGALSGACFTPDGGSVVYGASWEGQPYQIFTSRPESPESRSLGLPDANLLAVSAAGEMAISLGFHHSFYNTMVGTLARVPFAGGGVRPLLENVGHADWSPDGRTLAVVHYVDGRCRLEYPAGRVLVESPDWLSRPRVSKDGRRVAYADHPVIGDTSADICLVDEAGNRRTLIRHMDSVSGVCWSPSGDELWVSGIGEDLQNGIWGVDLSGSLRTLYHSPARIRLHDVASDGRMLVSIGNLRIGFNVSSDDDGSRETHLSWFDGSVAVDIGPDGRRILFFEGHEAENPHYAVYVRDVDGSPAIRLGDGIGTRLSPDGRWALAILNRPHHDLLVYPTGFGEPRSLRSDAIERALWAGWHPDGRTVFVIGSSPDHARRLFAQPSAGGPARMLWNEEIDVDWVTGVAISPEGGRLALRRTDGTSVIFRPREGRTEPLAIGADEVGLRFDDTGRHLYVSCSRDGSRCIERLDLESGARTPWRTLQPPDPTGILYTGHPVVTPRGHRYAYSFLRLLSDLYLVDGIA